MSCRQHGYPWPSLATSPYHSSPPAGLQGYMLCPRIVTVCNFELVVLLLHGQRKIFTSLYIYIYIYINIYILCWVLSKEASSTIFWVFGITRPGIEPRSPRPLARKLTILPMSGCVSGSNVNEKFLNSPQISRRRASSLDAIFCISVDISV